NQQLAQPTTTTPTTQTTATTQPYVNQPYVPDTYSQPITAQPMAQTTTTSTGITPEQQALIDAENARVAAENAAKVAPPKPPIDAYSQFRQQQTTAGGA